MTAVGDRFAPTRLQRVSVQNAEPLTPVRFHCPATDRPEHLWWGYHCRLDKAMQPRYGLTCDDYHRLLKSQGGVCGVCGLQPGSWRLVPDHDHETGAVRGLCHHRCQRWITTQVVRYLADPPGYGLAGGTLQVPAVKMRALEARAAAKQRRNKERRTSPVPDQPSDFHARTQAALEATKQGGT